MFSDDSFYPFTSGFDARDREYQATNTRHFGVFNNDDAFIDTTMLGGGLESNMVNTPFSSGMAPASPSYVASMERPGHAGVDNHHIYTEWPAFGVSSQSAIPSVQATTPGSTEPNLFQPVLFPYDQQNDVSAAAFRMRPGKYNPPHVASPTSSDSSPDLTSASLGPFLKPASPPRVKESFLEMLHGPRYLTLLAENRSSDDMFRVLSTGVDNPESALVGGGGLDANGGKPMTNLLSVRLSFTGSVGPLQDMGLDPCADPQKFIKLHTRQERICTEVPNEDNRSDKGQPLLVPIAEMGNEFTETTTTHASETPQCRTAPDTIPRLSVERERRKASTGTSMFQCSHNCGYASKDRRTLKRHEEIHTRTKNDHWFCPGVQAERGPEERPCTCPILGYTRRDRLSAHLRSQEEGSACYEAAWGLGWRPSVVGSVKKLQRFRPTRPQ